MRALLRHPLLRFAALGLAVFLGQNALQSSGLLHSPKPVLQLDAATVAQLRRQAEARGIPFAPLLRARVDEEVLIDQALARGLDRRDPVARRRLLQNMRLSYPEAGEAELLRRARALDMPRRDVLVRRRLIERMQGEITDGRDIAAAGAVPMAEQRQAPRMHLTHVFVAGSDAAARQRAEALQAALAREALSPEAAGDPHLGGRYLRDVAPADIRRQLGGAVAQAAQRAEAGQWKGPVASAQGWHLLRVTPSEAAVRSDAAWEQRAARYLTQEQRRHGAVAEELAGLRAGYTIQLPGAQEALRP